MRPPDHSDLVGGCSEHLAVFIADHLAPEHRREGSVAFFTDDAALVPRFLVVVPDAPTDPTDELCRRVLGRFAHLLCAATATTDESELTGSGFGLVSHRAGPPSVTDADRRWRRVADEVAGQLGMHVVGVVACTTNGAIVPVHRH